jgi:hypothetical protein
VSSFSKILRVTAAWIGAATLAGAAVAAHAEGTQPSFKTVEGAIAAVDFSAKKLVVHTAMDGDLTLFVGPTTRWSRGAGTLMPPAKPKTQAETAPDPSAFIGLYVRAQYNPATFLVSYIGLTAPTPLRAEGVVHSASPTGLSVDLPGGRSIQFTLDGNTVCRLDGQPVSGGGLAQFEPVVVSFLLKPTENLATQVLARGAPPRSLIGLLLPAVQDQAANGFSVKTNNVTLNFTVDEKTGFFINDRPASFADLKPNQPVFVQYFADGSVFVARRVAQSQKPAPTTEPKKPEPKTGDARNTDPKKEKTLDPPSDLVAALKALNEAKLHLKKVTGDLGGFRGKGAQALEQAIKNLEAALQFAATH